MKYKKEVYRSLALVTQFGINMLVPIFLCTFLGIFLDGLFHTSFLVIVFFFLGALAGFRNIYIFAKQIYEQPGTHHIQSDSIDGNDSKKDGKESIKRK